jgi:hypothetical protein
VVPIDDSPPDVRPLHIASCASAAAVRYETSSRGEVRPCRVDRLIPENYAPELGRASAGALCALALAPDTWRLTCFSRGSGASYVCTRKNRKNARETALTVMTQSGY